MAERILKWKAPTGRYLEPGKTFKVTGKSGDWVFIAYVDHPKAPYIECRDAGTPTKPGRPGVRCFRPELVHTVSNEIEETR